MTIYGPFRALTQAREPALERQKGIDTAEVVVALISTDFIADDRLMQLLESAIQQGKTIIPVYARPFDKEYFQESTGLGEFYPSAASLQSMAPVKQNESVIEICKNIQKEIEKHAPFPPAATPVIKHPQPILSESIAMSSDLSPSSRITDSTHLAQGTERADIGSFTRQRRDALVQQGYDPDRLQIHVVVNAKDLAAKDGIADDLITNMSSLMRNTSSEMTVSYDNGTDRRGGKPTHALTPETEAARIANADITLVLNSPNLQEDDHALDMVAAAIARYETLGKERNKVITITLKPTDSPIPGTEKFSPLPVGLKAVSSAPDRDEANMAVTKKIRASITEVMPAIGITLPGQKQEPRI